MLALWERNSRMTAPKGLTKFKDALRRIAAVPKEQVEQKIKAEQAARRLVRKENDL